MNDYFVEIGAWPSKPHIARSYVIGFLLSLLATIAAYALIVDHALAGGVLLSAVFVLAFAQFVVQLVCFLHLGGRASSRMRTVALLVTLVIVSILVIGSLWIMLTLSSRMMPSQDQMVQYMQDQGGL